MKIGFLELVVVFVVALLVIGPDRLPDFARKLGGALREFRRATADAAKDVRENVVEPLEEAQRPLREAMEPLEELGREVREDFSGVERDLRNLGKSTPKAKIESKEAPEADPQGARAGESAAAEVESEAGAAREEDNGGENG